MLTSELTVINQYFVDAKMPAHWGYERQLGVGHHLAQQIHD